MRTIGATTVNLSISVAQNARLKTASPPVNDGRTENERGTQGPLWRPFAAARAGEPHSWFFLDVINALGTVREGELRSHALGLMGVMVGLRLAYLGARGPGALLFGVEPGDPMVCTRGTSGP